MGEVLTTGQMIDQLKVGEVAKNNDDMKVYKSEDGSIRGDVMGRKILCDLDFLESKWRIQPNYVSFEDAMKALKDGKSVIFRGPDGSWSDKVPPNVAASIAIKHTELRGYGLLDLFKGKWTIEE
ncbi:hypothetical protein AQ616_18795 [Oceanobacillus sp. E9]|uniref:hypothetical protein n=1 Tax=Oceanobacillus sp. E9 TaxID=1742575 RepID=UPI00084E4A7F|nr:hypothetical protein [Oceanobacillus sp. E9]OEH52954.1 hypothetical protein AQ616_18795 [Oceanobacillus sp. E9]